MLDDFFFHYHGVGGEVKYLIVNLEHFIDSATFHFTLMIIFMQNTIKLSAFYKNVLLT